MSDSSLWIPARPSHMPTVACCPKNSIQKNTTVSILLASWVATVALAVLLYKESNTVEAPLLLKAVTYGSSFLNEPVAYVLVSFSVVSLAVAILLGVLYLVDTYRVSRMDEKVVNHYIFSEKPSHRAITWIMKRPRALDLLLNRRDADLTKGILGGLFFLKTRSIHDKYISTILQHAVDHYKNHTNPHIDAIRWIAKNHPNLQQLDVDFNKASPEFPFTLLGGSSMSRKVEEFVFIWDRANDETKKQALLKVCISNITILRFLIDNGKIPPGLITREEQNGLLGLL